MSDIVINPTMQVPEIKKMGVVIGNVFVPTMQILGVLYRCGFAQKTVQPTMTVSGAQYYTVFNGTYIQQQGTSYNYFKKTDSNYCIARYASNKNRWVMISGELPNEQGLVTDNYYYVYYNDTGSQSSCPQKGWIYSDYGQTDSNMLVDVMPSVNEVLEVNDCGRNASYIFNGVVGLNSSGKCAEILQNQKTEVPYLMASSITTPNVVTYWGDVQLIDKRTGDIDSIYRCNFTTGELYKIRVDGYVTPEYQLMPNGKTLETAYDFKEMVDGTGKAHLACYSDTNIFYVKRYCYSGVSYSVSGDGNSYGHYQDKRAGLMNESGNYIIGMFDNDSLETATYTASYTGWHYYVCAPYSGGNWDSGAGLDITWTITSGTQPTE